jgi:hypothetical protein
VTQSSWSAIAARIVAQIQTVPKIGNVYDRLRLATADNSIDAIISASIDGEPRARVWMVTMGRQDTKFEDAGGSMQWDRTAVIEGFLQIEDANDSATMAVGLAEAIIRVLATDVRTKQSNGLYLGGTVLTGKPPRITTNELRVFFAVACHYIRVEMPLTTLEF